MNLRDAEDRSALAGEYVLGTLSADDKAVFERALASDAALRAEVYAWQDRLVGLAGTIAPVDPPPQLWARIESRLAAGKEGRESRDPPVPIEAWLRRQLRRWQLAFAGALVASVVLAATALGFLLEAGGERYIALLEAPDRSIGWVVEGRAGGRLRLVPLVEAYQVPAGRSLQFWTKPENAAGPTSLGLVRAGETIELPSARLPGLGARQLFELTLEPEGGSPLDRPTGPILFIGRAARL